jgi:hypothetical protein
MRGERSADWPEKLADFIHSKATTPFEWGVNDCALFAADCVKAITDIDLATDLRGTYATAREAYELIKDRGGLEAIATAALGQPMEFKLQMQRGDVALVNINGRESLVICADSVLVGPAVESGIALIPITEAVKAWEV